MRVLVAIAALASVAGVPATAAPMAKVTLADTVAAGKSTSVQLVAQKRASFRVVLRVPTQGRAQLFLTGKTAPKGGPLIDTKTYACEGAAGSLYCRGAYEPLPKGRYTWRIRWLGAKPAHVELTVRW